MAGVALSIATIHPVRAANWLLSTLHGFGSDSIGTTTPAGVIRGNDGNFYGSSNNYTASGHASLGTVFKMTPDGTVSVVHTIGMNEYIPDASLMQAVDGSLYGTQISGGGYPWTYGLTGRIVRITLSGAYSLLHTCTPTEGFYPMAPLIQGSDGNFYGTARFGGPSYVDDTHPGYGTIFKMTPDGAVTTLVSRHNIDGEVPSGAWLKALTAASTARCSSAAYAPMGRSIR
jgi:uncharacterized repeat protein (TIGR03803 family)